MKKLLTLAMICFIALPSHAQTPRLTFPVDCILGTDCWTVNYVDTDAENDMHKDFMCNTKTTENHQGTDFALRSRIEMQKGVNVLAAMDGTVLRIRNGEDDTLKTHAQYEAIRAANKDCGNGVLIDHGQGKQSFYCHLKQDSITVKPGDKITAGRPIAQIGQSGYAEFPHLHFAFIWEGAHIDPFTGINMGEGCGMMKKPLWKTPIAYEPFTVFDGGFEAGLPDFKTIKAGRIHPVSLPLSAEALVFWIGFYHAQPGDILEMRITDPEGRLFAKRVTSIEKGRKRPNFYYTGRKTTNTPLVEGLYTGTAIFKRVGLPDKTIIKSIKVNALSTAP